ncbi:hypothetical protein NQZ68_034209 [Dissostichus eleginoides]|nr:hypothetical protein NQZ68_034209 [Dissostichus eleginoides]
MAFFDLDSFLVCPSHEQLDRCRKDDLYEIAQHFSLALEAKDKEQNRQFQLEVKKLEIEADKEVRMRQLELDSQLRASGAFDHAGGSLPLPSHPHAFNMKLCQTKSQKVWFPLLMRMLRDQRNTPAQTNLSTLQLSQ